MISTIKPSTEATPPVLQSLRDRLGRPFEDLRISVTRECNFRCPYCMPEAHFPLGFGSAERDGRLGFDEIARFVEASLPLGLRKIRLTGGEPLLRAGLARLVEKLAAFPEIEDIALTTNGLLLGHQAAELAAAGLQRVNVSLDGISREAFLRMTGGYGDPERVVRGIDAARAAGLRVKLNMVPRRGWNEDEIVPLAEFARERGLPMRFIEFMDVGMTNGWSSDQVITAKEILDTLSEIAPLSQAAPEHAGETATLYHYQDGIGEIGIISSVTRPFCRGCRRARLSSEGKLHTCLFSGIGHDLRGLLDHRDRNHLTSALAAIWSARDDRYSEIRASGVDAAPRPEMSYLGG